MEPDVVPLLPLPAPELVKWRRLRSCRLRARQKRKLQVQRVVWGMIKTVNALGSGHVKARLTLVRNGDIGRQMTDTGPQSLALRNLLHRASQVARARRGEDLTGVQQALSLLMKAPLDESGYVRPTGVRQVPLQADLVVEPKDEGYIEMLQALPDEDSMYYSRESHVVDWDGKSSTLFKEIEERYGFIGGTLDEYVRYLSRPDVTHLWEWDMLKNVRAIAGVSTVLKKNGKDQRKLIMQVASNYVFEDATNRADIGMGGGSSLSRCHVASDSMAVASCDEDSAFTYVKVPEWMAAWQSGPPVKAAVVWNLLSSNLRSQITSPLLEYVAPKYLRLAMGGSHSVYILMRINLHHVGRTLFNYAARLRLDNGESTTGGASQRLEDDPYWGEYGTEQEPTCPDIEWETRQHLRRMGMAGKSQYTVDEWVETVRRSKCIDSRVFVAIHMFAGERRDGDIQQCLEQMCAGEGIKLLMLSVDLAVDPLWDFTNQTTFHQLMLLAEEGCIDLWIGGPPCSTVARARHVPLRGGPRPLRFRWALWGREGLRPWERTRVIESNILWTNFFAMGEAVGSRGGGYLMEHPADPGRDPYPSIWLLPEVHQMEQNTGGHRVHLHQCVFGGIAPKLTTLSGNLDGMEELDGVRCPGESEHHQHGVSIGRDPEGGFYTRRLQTYPAKLCMAIAKMMFLTLCRFAQSLCGPTGPLSGTGHKPAPRVTAWSTWEGVHGSGTCLLNEATAKQQSVLVTQKQSGVYVHVDDTVVISDSSSGSLHPNNLLDELVSGLQDVGFQVTQQSRSGEVSKVVGYEVQQRPAEFRLPVRKMVLLRVAFLGLAGQKLVNVEVLRSLVGMWIFGSLLRRELLSIPHSIFRFMETFEGQTVLWWPSAREEAVAMGQLTALMYCHVGAPLLQWCFATDAMGMNDSDMGGYGIVGTAINPPEALALLRHGEAPGRSIARLDGTQEPKFKGKAMTPTVPFTLLPPDLLQEERWTEIARGRWRFGDHITIGEARTVLLLVKRLASWSGLHDHAVFSLQDNQPTAGAMAKGRSPSFALNRVLRQKAGYCLAAQIRLFLPWVESAKQPADKSSRIQ